jgi:2,5-diketo-D-gluconate reductase A
VVIPKASQEDRLRANLDVFDLTLTDDDVRRIDALDTGVQVGGQDPSTHEEF